MAFMWKSWDIKALPSALPQDRTLTFAVVVSLRSALNKFSDFILKRQSENLAFVAQFNIMVIVRTAFTDAILGLLRTDFNPLTL